MPVWFRVFGRQVFDCHPDLMAFTAKQLALSHSAAPYAFRRIAELSGGEWLERDGLLLYRTLVPDPIVWNGAIVTGEPHGSPTQLLECADDFFAPHAVSYGFWTIGSRDTALAQFLSAGHAELVDDSPHMIADTATVRAVASSIAVELVVDDAGRRAFIDVAAAAFETIGANAATWPIVYPTLASVRADDVIAMVARAEGRYVGAAMGYLHGGACYPIHVATVPVARRRGIGAAITAAVVVEGRARGATLAALQATELGEGVYRSLGFHQADRYRLHLRTVAPTR
jgi:GNAT superfamily N-acetyltransferase